MGMKNQLIGLYNLDFPFYLAYNSVILFNQEIRTLEAKDVCLVVHLYRMQHRLGIRRHRTHPHLLHLTEEVGQDKEAVHQRGRIRPISWVRRYDCRRRRFVSVPVLVETGKQKTFEKGRERCNFS